MGLAFQLGRIWGGASALGRGFAVAAIGLLLSAPYLAIQYIEYHQTKKAEVERLAMIEKVRQRLAAEQARVAALTPEQRASELRAAESRAEVAKNEEAALARAKADASASEAKRKQRLLMAALGARQLRDAMKDPEAFVLTSALLQPSGIACYDYRAKNSFGATLPSSALLKPDGKFLLQEQHGNAFVSAWNKECTTSGGDDITGMVKRAL